MSKNTSVNLGEHFNSFIDSQIELGRYSTASEVVRAALRLLENQETKLNVIRTKLAASELQAEKGEYADYSLEMLIDQLSNEAIS